MAIELTLRRSVLNGVEHYIQLGVHGMKNARVSMAQQDMRTVGKF